MERSTILTVILGLMVYVVSFKLTSGQTQKIALPLFKDLQANYPGYFHHNGPYRNHAFLSHLELKDTDNLLIHDTSALRLSYTLNKIGGEHSLGGAPIHFSKYGHDSVEGKGGQQFIFLPIAYGPYLADKYGYPNSSKLHDTDPLRTKHLFWGKQGILRVITYTHHGNEPKGHVALWNCDHFYQSNDWIAGNTLLTVEFWESPDSHCPVIEEPSPSPIIPNKPVPSQSKQLLENGSINDNQSNDSSDRNNQSKLATLLGGDSIRSRQYLKHLIVPENVRHSVNKRQRLGKT